MKTSHLLLLILCLGLGLGVQNAQATIPGIFKVTLEVVNNLATPITVRGSLRDGRSFNDFVIPAGGNNRVHFNLTIGYLYIVDFDFFAYGQQVHNTGTFRIDTTDPNSMRGDNNDLDLPTDVTVGIDGNSTATISFTGNLTIIYTINPSRQPLILIRLPIFNTQYNTQIYPQPASP